jgi:HNH endonuclease/NUMOD4 motif
MIEEWRTVDVVPAYQVSSLGRVKRIVPGRGARVGRILRATPDKDGYLVVSLSIRNERSVVKVHHLVLWAFVGPRPSREHECAHGDGNQANNNFDNLSWKTSKENKADKIRHGTHGLTLTIDDVREIRARRELGHTHKKIATDLELGLSAVGHVIMGHCWANL